MKFWHLCLPLSLIYYNWILASEQDLLKRSFGRDIKDRYINKNKRASSKRYNTSNSNLVKNNLSSSESNSKRTKRDNSQQQCTPRKPPKNNLKAKETIREAGWFAYMTGTSYCEDDVIDKWVCSHCKKANNVRLLKKIRHNGLNLRALILVDEEKKDLIISFRGSDGAAQAFKLISFTQVPYLDNKERRVQDEFLKRANALYEELAKVLSSILKEYKCHRKVLVGHSLGGALAILTAPKIEKDFSIPFKDISIYTYGQPRIGNVRFARWYNELPILYIRAVNGRDLVPHMPSGSDFSHINQELFVDDDPKLCSTRELEDPNCSNYYTFYSPFPSTHNHIMGVSLGRSGC